MMFALSILIVCRRLKSVRNHEREERRFPGLGRHRSQVTCTPLFSVRSAEGAGAQVPDGLGTFVRMRARRRMRAGSRLHGGASRGGDTQRARSVGGGAAATAAVVAVRGQAAGWQPAAGSR